MAHRNRGRAVRGRRRPRGGAGGPRATEVEIKALLSSVAPSFAALGDRIENQTRIEQQAIAVLRRAPAPVAVALRRRLEELEVAGRAAHQRSTAAQHAVDQANATIGDFRHALDQLTLLQAPPAGGVEVAA